MKKTLLATLFFCCTLQLQGQIDFEKYIMVHFGDPKEQAISIVTAVQDIGLYSVGMDTRDAYPSLRDTAFEAKFNRGTFVNRVDSTEGHFFVNGINRANAKEYEYRIFDNKGKIIVPWQKINQFAPENAQIRDDLPKGMAYLGSFPTAWNAYTAIEIREKGTNNIVASSAMYGQQIKPVLLNIYTNAELNQFFSTAKQAFPLHLDQYEIQGWAEKYTPEEIDKQTFLPKKLILDSNEHDVIFLLNATIFPKQALEHKIIKDGKVLKDWQSNYDDYNNFISLKNLEHGEYELLIRYAVQRHNITKYPFKIKPKWYQTERFQMIMNSLSFLILLILLPSLIFLQQKQKLKKQKQLNEKIIQELKSIRAQLNPHFVFNALNSIQSLMNKGDLTNANYYLTEFSTLLRESLANNDKENVPLSIELKTLETYIKLEQLRFPFTYSIDIDKTLDVHAIEIPYLFLQPLVENAIKHGVSNLYEKGVLAIRVYPKKDDLVLEIKDNGKGFDTAAESMGYGLKLTKERARLLSESNRQQPIQFGAKCGVENGTTAFLVFKNWL